MNELSIERINDNAPYDVCYDKDGSILFCTDYGVEYSVSFDDDPNPYFVAYWFNLSNINNRPSPGDPKIPQTVICIIEEFFYQNPDILLYMCDNANGQQAQRSRLFLRWFNGAEQQRKYDIRTALLTEEGIDSYIAMIIQRSHPQYEEILHIFDTEISIFKENKP